MTWAQPAKMAAAALRSRRPRATEVLRRDRHFRRKPYIHYQADVIVLMIDIDGLLRRHSRMAHQDKKVLCSCCATNAHYSSTAANYRHIDDLRRNFHSPGGNSVLPRDEGKTGPPASAPPFSMYIRRPAEKFGRLRRAYFVSANDRSCLFGDEGLNAPMKASVVAQSAVISV